MHKMQYLYIISNVTYVIVTEICGCGLPTSGAKLQGDKICYNCGSSVWKSCHVSFLAPRILKRLLDF